MSNTYILAGASSKTAIATATLLREQHHKVIGISTKANLSYANQNYQVEDYGFSSFPKLSETVDGLVYFPGTINLKPFQRLSETDFLKDYKVNALGAVAFIQNYISNLKNSSNASIVLISSVAAQSGMPFHSSITMAKSAVEGLTKSLAAEFAPQVRVNCIAPSLTDTPLAEKIINTPEKRELLEKRNPLKKIGKPNDLANAIYFLLSENSSWITGQIIGVDGGMNNIKL